AWAVVLFVVKFQEIQTKIAIKPAPHRVDVIGIILSVVILNQERGTLQSIVVWFPTLETACPCKMEFIDACLFEASQLIACQIFRQVMGILVKQIRQLLQLWLAHLAGRQACRLTWLGLTRVAGDDVFRGRGIDHSYLQLLRSQSLSQVAGQVFLLSQNSQ